MIETQPTVGILVLNYHQPEATLDCVRRLLEVEGPGTRVIWLENDAAAAGDEAAELLAASGLPWRRLDPEGPLPEAGEVGYLANAANLGYAGGNNVGIRFLGRHGVPYSWVLNNDTVLVAGSSADLLAAAQAEPEVGLWGMALVSGSGQSARAWQVSPRDFATGELPPDQLGTHPMAYICGCSMLFRTADALRLGGIPEEYFLYYEDVAFSWEFRKAGFRLGSVPAVSVRHLGSLASGERSPRVEYYCRRNRLRLIQRYFPARLGSQVLRLFTYQLQKLLVRGKFARLRLEWQAYADFRAGRLGRTARDY
jgi:GT2 family glycosyltransferase